MSCDEAAVVVKFNIPTLPPMKQQSIMREGLVNGLRALYETESRLSRSVDHILNITDAQQVKAELVVYLVSLRKNTKAIEHIFCLLNEEVVPPAGIPSVTLASNYTSIHPLALTDCWCDYTSTPLQFVMDRKMSLYSDAHRLAVKLNQPKIAFILYDILEFENETQVIFNEVQQSGAPLHCAVG